MNIRVQGEVGTLAQAGACIPDLEAQIGNFIERYNHHRYHESLGNVTPADALRERARIKRQTIELRRLHHRKIAA